MVGCLVRRKIGFLAPSAPFWVWGRPAEAWELPRAGVPEEEKKEKEKERSGKKRQITSPRLLFPNNTLSVGWRASDEPEYAWWA